MNLGPVPDYIKSALRKHFLAGLQNSPSLETYELDLFRWFKNDTERVWAEMDAAEQQFVREQIAAGADDVNDSGFLAVGYYRRRMRSSHVVFLASLLEGAMKRECERISIALGEQVLFKPAELKGDPWSVRRIFIEKYGAFTIPPEKWAPIKNLLEVRNALVHHNAEVSLLTPEQISKLAKVPGITTNESEIGIEINYIDSAEESVRELMEFIHANVNSLIDRAISPKAIR